MNQLEIPVLFLVFNRPGKTLESFNAIREVKPKKLYVAADSPRINQPDDAELCEKVRAIVKNVDWECEAHYLFNDKNLGCSLAGKTAWDWFFSQEEEMIFIEDDGVPAKSFFFYCQELLRKYRNDRKIAYIGGVNYGIQCSASSYFFSRQCAATYSMATWKRVYDLYEYDLESYPLTKDIKSFKHNFLSSKDYLLYKMMFKSFYKSVIKNKRHNTYDIQMIYLSYKYDMYSIYPNTNMVSNIGLDSGANNRVPIGSQFYQKYSNRPCYEMSTIKHPATFSIDAKNEKKMFKERSLHQGNWLYVYINYFLRDRLRKYYKYIMDHII